MLELGDQRVNPLLAVAKRGGVQLRVVADRVDVPLREVHLLAQLAEELCIGHFFFRPRFGIVLLSK